MEILKLDSSNYAVLLKKGEEFMSKLKSFAEKEKIQFASVSAIGALKDVEIAYFVPDTKEYLRKTFVDDFELISANGNITRLEDGTPFIHIHCSLTAKDYTALGGHLMKATIAVTAEIFVQSFSKDVRKIHDKETGIKLWKF